MAEMIKLLLQNGNASCVVIDGKDLVQKAVDIHGLSPVGAAAMGRTLMGSLIMASDIKDEKGDVSVTIDGGGPLGRIIAVANAKGHVRGCIDHPEATLPPRSDGKLDVGGAVGKEGRLVVVRDLGYGEPYVGQVALTSGEIAEDMAYYYVISQQQPCLLYLGVLVDTDGSILSASGLGIFPLPGCPESDIRALELGRELYPELTNALRDRTLEEAADLVLAGLTHRITERKKVDYVCNCSREKMEKALISIGQRDLIAMIEEDQGCEICCHFCGSKYYFDAPALLRLLGEATQQNIR
ncbi:MAG: Hsp33 family molecular chaperone HslO [Clostridiales bacterium]|nr:Hsp33 family molecular chaperone HslO [Clostridiales bacterium]